ncbi:late sexual development protein [Lophiotrema nucula]|uniref:Late sexual development protein n=1 Tax=Lophiotrema nucula TaxID=690887 RepID=A0A6A5ZKC8_9PLEO|nr:late sexual development protein [Lophiotrema nucula]
MKSFSIAAALLAATATAAPAAIKRQADFSPDGNYFPLSNGFPNPSPDQILKIQKQAFGTLPNGPPPPSISDDTKTSLKLIALNELFEVAFFTELLYNVTNKVHGYDIGYGHDYVLHALSAIIAQEELHALNANGALKNFGEEPIQPCKYTFPVTDFPAAIGLAATFTDVVLGTLQDVQFDAANNKDAGIVRSVGSVIGQEGEQEGFFRLILKKNPSALPFLTTSVRDFAFTAIQGFTIPGSCPNINTIPLQTFGALTVLTNPVEPKTQNLEFSISKSQLNSTKYDDFSVVYINQQNLPVVKAIQNPHWKHDTLVFEAGFPFDEFEMNGLTIAAVVEGKGPFATADDVAKVAKFGPGLIEIN